MPTNPDKAQEFPAITGKRRTAQKRVELRIPADLADEIEALMPRTQTLPSFCALLIEQELTRVRTLPAYRVGAGNPGHLTTESSFQGSIDSDQLEAQTSLQPSDSNVCLEHMILADGVGKGLSGETPRKVPLTSSGTNKPTNAEPIPAARVGSPRQANTKGSPEFEAFWRQYQAIKRRASNQSKPKALEVWNAIVPDVSPADLSKALACAVTQQVRQERDGGFASPFPDCFRWLRDGYYENHLEAAALPTETPAAVVGGWQPNTEDPTLPF